MRRKKKKEGGLRRPPTPLVMRPLNAPFLPCVVNVSVHNPPTHGG